ncbi:MULTISPECIES: c-type cytochrome [Undibacterium]|jgi:cytochrome c|uniref:C-type cytochrome n=2 Tax=Undibacterium TaxID=401469 RepID=A0ABS5H6M9_9BURK|nr:MULTISPECIES: c-type cytochrome [Undibacterium]MBC3812902.1 c-type cytochrome [Undibacterium aquatile]MBC3879205.1 c-type cytochrome [Undibacterium sp. FT79W]MBC3929466.1 c-type cytochrome [Undibacterium sp. CY21W]MBR7793744.1 c-type cytochrome [Undibacterium rivi]
MKHQVTLSLLSALGIAALAFSATSSYAATGAELAQKNGCMACHGVDKKILGPAFKDIAQKYKGNADAVASLSKKIKDGGSGVWGAIPMPPNGPKVNDADIKTLAEYVLSTH